VQGPYRVDEAHPVGAPEGQGIEVDRAIRVSFEMGESGQTARGAESRGTLPEADESRPRALQASQLELCVTPESEERRLLGMGAPEQGGTLTGLAETMLGKEDLEIEPARFEISPGLDGDRPRDGFM